MTDLITNVIDGWEGRNVFIRHSLPTRTRNARARSCVPKHYPAPLYIIVYWFRPKGTTWHSNTPLIHPQIFGSMKEADACFALCGFSHLLCLKPELSDRVRWKYGAAYENARVWAKKERTRRNAETE